MKMKECNECNQVLPVTEFHKDRRDKKWGLQGKCKACNQAVTNQLQLRQACSVYVLTCIPTGEQYVGSTTQCPRKRLTAHWTDSRRGSNMNLHGCMRVFNKRSMWQLTVVEEHMYGTLESDELRAREQSWIDNVSPILNTNNAVREVA